jgi:phosphoribosylaminoimidazole carboxylase (NCAIR synthetase)
MSGLHGTWKGLVLKKARMGYDGKGNLALPPFSSQTSAANLTPSLDLKKIKAFCESAFSTGSRVYAEKFVPFAKEVALVSVRSFAGDYGHFPLVETVQHNGVCFLAFKALHSEVLQARAREIAQALGENLKLLGTYAVEFFVTAQGDLIVNEMAPRVHNSGHFTQKAARSSQFEMHLKSYYQSKFEADDFHCAPAFAMVNLLGPSGFSGPVQKPTQSGIYWYDKESTTPGRKLGHIIAQSSQESELPKLLESLQQSERHWRESLLKA